MARVVIAGCGDVGSAAGVLFAQGGHEVFGIRRSPGAPVAGINMIAADLCDAHALRALPSAVEIVIYVAAADEFTDAAYQRAYVQGLQTVLQALHGSSLRKVLFVSSTSVYAQNDGAWIDEDSAALASSFSGQRLLEAEASVSASGVPSCVVRFGGIYGPGRTRLFEQVRAGATCVEDPPQWTNRIHRDDCAAVLHHLALKDNTRPLYLGVDTLPAARCEVLQWLARQMAAPTPVCESSTAQSGAGSRRRGGNKRCSSKRLVDSGYRFKYPTYKQGYSALLNLDT